MPKNEHGQEIGAPIENWKAPEHPKKQPTEGRYCRLEPLESKHAKDLFEANAVDAKGLMWTYLPYGPFETLAAYEEWVNSVASKADPQFYAIIDLAIGKAVGLASYLRIDTIAGSIEVGHIAYSPLLQTRTLATEAMFLMMDNAFSKGFRRYEWKCDALNEKSRNAAHRLGFSFEGIFRQATHYKNRNRDTAWFSMIDKEWPQIKLAYETWLDPENFDDQGKQKKRLNDLINQTNQAQE